MPDTGASRKRQIARRHIPGDLAIKDHRAIGPLGRILGQIRSVTMAKSFVDWIRACRRRGSDHVRVIFVQHVSKNIRLLVFGTLPLSCAGKELW